MRVDPRWLAGAGVARGDLAEQPLGVAGGFAGASFQRGEERLQGEGGRLVRRERFRWRGEVERPEPDQLFEHGEEVGPLLGAEQPAAASGVGLRVGVGVLEGESGLALAAQTVDRAHQADALLGDHGLVELAQLAMAPHEMGVGLVDVAGRQLGERGLVEARGDAAVDGGDALRQEARVAGVVGARLGVQRGEPLGGVQLAQHFGADGKPRAQVEGCGPIAAAEVLDPGGELAVERGRGAVGAAVEGVHGHEVDRQDAVVAAREGVLEAQVLFPLAAAPRAREVIGREEGQEEPRGAQAAVDPALPVVAVADRLAVEEHREGAPREVLVCRPKTSFEGGHPAARVIGARVGEEEVIGRFGHGGRGFWLPGIRQAALPRPGPREHRCAVCRRSLAAR